MRTKQAPTRLHLSETNQRFLKKWFFFPTLVLMMISWFYFASWTFAAENPEATDTIHPPAIMTWVTLSRANVWKAKLEADYGGPYSPKNTITRIGAQFFNVRPDGSISRPKSDADLLWLQKFCRTNGIRLLLCFTNFGPKGFDWSLAESAFNSHKDALIANMMGLVDQWSADGIDIDFEGIVKDNPYRSEFADFIKELAVRLHQKGKVLTVDSFPYVWSAPNVNWWADWRGYVDCIHSMGYDSLCGGSPTEWKTYKWQQDQALSAGLTNDQLAFGMAGDQNAYGEGGLGSGILDHIRENLSGNFNAQPSSICIWSAAFGGKAWETPDVWEALHQLRTVPCRPNNNGDTDQTANQTNNETKTVIGPPAAPINLTCQEKTLHSATLTWSAPKNNRGVTYIIYLDGKIVGLTSFTDFTMKGLSGGTSYCFVVKAQNDLGEASATLTVTTDPDIPAKH